MSKDLTASESTAPKEADPFQAARELLQLYQLDRAQETLNAMQAGLGSRYDRERLQLLAQVEMRRGHFEAALELVDSALREHGSYIGLKADRLSCLYHLGRTIQWRAQLQDFETSLRQYRSDLSEDTLSRSELILAKFLEEEGEIAKALQIYEAMAARCESSGQLKSRSLVLAQILRIRATFERDPASIASIYRELHTLETADNSLYREIEIQHALMLSDLACFDLQRGLRRIEWIQNYASPQDLRLFQFDALEELLLLGQRDAISDMSEIPPEEKFQPFEKALISLQQNPDARLVTDHLAREMSFSCYYRILCLMKQPAIEKEREILLLTLTTESRQMWRNRMKLRTPARLVILDPQRREIICGDRRIDLKRKSTTLHLLRLLFEKPNWPAEEICARLWHSDYDYTYYNRLRVLSQRVQTVLKELTDQSDLIHFANGDLQLISHLGNLDFQLRSS